jgi:hypothetical protein
LDKPKDLKEWMDAWRIQVEGGSGEIWVLCWPCGGRFDI